MINYTALSRGPHERSRKRHLLTQRWMIIPLFLITTTALYFLYNNRAGSTLHLAGPSGRRIFPPPAFVTPTHRGTQDLDGKVEMTGLKRNRGRKVLNPKTMTIEEFPFGSLEEANQWAEERLRVCLTVADDSTMKSVHEEWVEDEWLEGKEALLRRKEWEDLDDYREDSIIATEETTAELKADDLPLGGFISMESDPDVSQSEKSGDMMDFESVIPPNMEQWEESKYPSTQEDIEDFDDLSSEENGNYDAVSPHNIDVWVDIPTVDKWEDIGETSKPPSMAVCGQNETKVAILASYWFVEGLKGVNTGEAVWARSIINSLYAQNYTILFSSLGWMNNDPSLLLDLYDRYKSHIHVIIAEPTQIEQCWGVTSAGGCLKSERNPSGIPAWKLLSFHYWDSVANPLGEGWTLSPSPTNGNRFISYSIEATCQHHPYVVASKREKQIYLFGKQTSYFSPTSERPCPWSIPFLATLGSSFHTSNGENMSTRVVLGAVNDDQDADDLLHTHADTIHNLGKMAKDEFLDVVSQSSAFVGVGRPAISPSPFDALCVGVPFVNPVVEWDERDPMNRKGWTAQQWWMMDLEPPYVYHVWAGDEAGMKLAIQTALDNPIESFIPERMTFEFVCEAMALVMEEDWRGMGERVLEERIRMGEGDVFIV